MTAAQLASRLLVLGLRCTEGQARGWLTDWERRGIAEQHLGRWRLTKSGQAMFSAWVDDDEGGEEAA